MRRRATLFIALLFLLANFLLPNPLHLLRADSVEPRVVYFYNDICSSCRDLDRSGALDDLESLGVIVERYDTMTSHGARMFQAYRAVYDVRYADTIPIIFVSDTYYSGVANIRNNIDEIASLASQPLLDVSAYAPEPISFWAAFFTSVFYGIIDGINPCAIAMLLMFISMVKVAEKRRTLAIIAFSYIGAVFITYFAISIGVMAALGSLMLLFIHLSRVLYVLFGLLFLFLAAITFYDYLVTKNQKYEKIKNQLPKFIQSFNKRVMTKLSDAINNEEGSTKQALLIVVLPFVTGVIVGVTEAACTGQIMLAFVAQLEISFIGVGVEGTRLFFLFIFNVFFILPLVIIAILSIRSKNVMAVSNLVREHLAGIKLFTAIFFALMVVYFGFLFFGTDLIVMLYQSIRTLLTGGS